MSSAPGALLYHEVEKSKRIFVPTYGVKSSGHVPEHMVHEYVCHPLHPVACKILKNTPRCT
jgi:hypothetical protein